MLLSIIMFQGYHGLSKDDDRLWAMEIDREHSRGGGVLHHSHNPAHPLGWTGLVETLPPPPGALPLPPPPPPHNSAGDPNGHPPPGNSGTPVSTGQVSPGQLTAGSLLADSPLVDWFRPVPVEVTTIIYQLGTAVPGAELQPARPLVPTPTTTTTRPPPPGPTPPTPPPPPPAWSGRARGEPSVLAGSGGRQTRPQSGHLTELPGNPRGCPPRPRSQDTPLTIQRESEQAPGDPNTLPQSAAAAKGCTTNHSNKLRGSICGSPSLGPNFELLTQVGPRGPIKV